MEEELILEAKLLHTIFYNEANGYAVGKFITYDANEEDFIGCLGVHTFYQLLYS